ncbi:hypothetical protein OH76DRAFT_330019 [Lentinus brumalis]|uniref:Uncharacterized protein n=1 Tax=Lentinus brumalis TaxID=2498619 RepID=A0A371DFR4_9APHY|nr:hypothetical protein OH76DRAFT_330019 [Polyporus brumalis]
MCMHSIEFLSQVMIHVYRSRSGRKRERRTRRAATGRHGSAHGRERERGDGDEDGDGDGETREGSRGGGGRRRTPQRRGEEKSPFQLSETAQEHKEAMWDAERAGGAGRRRKIGWEPNHIPKVRQGERKKGRAEETSDKRQGRERGGRMRAVGDTIGTVEREERRETRRRALYVGVCVCVCGYVGYVGYGTWDMGPGYVGYGIWDMWICGGYRTRNTKPSTPSTNAEHEHKKRKEGQRWGDGYVRSNGNGKSANNKQTDTHREADATIVHRQQATSNRRTVGWWDGGQASKKALEHGHET